MPLEIHNHQKVREDRISRLKKVLQITTFVAEMTAKALIIPAAGITAISPGTGVEKVDAGMKSPIKIYSLVTNLPHEIEQVDLLIETISELESIKDNEDASLWDKFSKIHSMASEKLPSIIDTLKSLGQKGFNHLKDLQQAKENFSKMPIETISATIFVMVAYWIFAFGMRCIRLKDQDSWSDKIRKKIYKKLVGKTSFESELEEQLGYQPSEEELAQIIRLALETYRTHKTHHK